MSCLVQMYGAEHEHDLTQFSFQTTDRILGYEITQCSGVHAHVWTLTYCAAVVYRGGEKGCRHKRLALLKAEHGTGHINWQMPTLGGKQYWADVYVVDGWHIQYHVWTQHFRLLSPTDVRHAWGSWGACRTVLAAKRMRTQAAVKTKTSVVFMLHGILRSKDSLNTVARTLSTSTQEVININYPSRHKDLPALAKNIHFLLNQRTDIQQISWVTHSMGGLLLRELMRDETQPWRQRCQLSAAVMVFSPNQGAYKANRWHERWWYQAVMGPAGESLTSASAQALPRLPMPLGVIVGMQGNEKGRSRIIPGDDDGTVGISETRLQSGVAQPTDYAYRHVGHTYGMNDLAVLADIQHFLQQHSFPTFPTSAPK